jgi:hypothetical protein
MGWIQKATDSIKRRGTEGVCTGDKFGGPSCRPGTKRYNLAKTFKKMSKKQKGGSYDEALKKANNAVANQIRMQIKAKAKKQEKKFKEKKQFGGAVGPNGIL